MLALLLLCVAQVYGCVDDRGRPGSYERIDTCRGAVSCPASLKIACVLHEFPPRAAHGKWECDEGYELAGARHTWPDGALVVQPDKCTPEGGRIGNSAPPEIRPAGDGNFLWGGRGG